jgi:hypothetical protein
MFLLIDLRCSFAGQLVTVSLERENVFLCADLSVEFRPPLARKVNGGSGVRQQSE